MSTTGQELKEAREAYKKLYPTTFVSFRVPISTLKKIDESVKKDGFPNRTEFILKALSHFLGEC